MPNLNEMMESRYLKRGDVTPPKVFTIRNFQRMNMAKPDQDPQYKWICEFDGDTKPLVCNKTNLKRMAKIFASENTDNWIGKRVEVYFDETIEMGGEVVGGIRVRKPRGTSAPVKPAQRPVIDPDKVNAEIEGGVEAMDDDIPF